MTADYEVMLKVSVFTGLVAVREINFSRIRHILPCIVFVAFDLSETEDNTKTFLVGLLGIVLNLDTHFCKEGVGYCC